MSSVDSRVVQMEFDDSNFDDGVQRAIKSMKELDDGLVLKNGTKGLDNIQKAAQSFDVSGALNSLQSISSTAAQVADSTVKSFLSIVPGINNALEIAKKLGGTIFNLMKEGGFSRALNIEQATWKMKNLGMDVKATQEDIDYAVSGTRFGFDEAANAAAQFGASGVKSGEQMKTALRGISGVATMTNSEYSSIADVFTKIASNGRVMTMELRQISARGLNAAKALADYFHTTEANIYELVTKGEIGFDDFAKAMDAAFGEASTKANETFSGALANMKAAVKRIGAEVAAPVIDNARRIFVNVIPLVNNINNAFKSYGKGTYKEIKKPTDYIKKQLDETGKYVSKQGRIYEKQGEKYVEWVDSYYVEKPSKALQKALKDTNYYVDKYGDTYKKVITKNGAAIRKYISGESLFGVIRNDIIKARKVINEFIKGFTDGGMDSAISKYAYSFTKVFLGIRNVVIGLFNILKPLGSAISMALKPFLDADVVLNVASSFKDITEQFRRFTEVAKIGEKTLLPIAGLIATGLTFGLKQLSGAIAVVTNAFSGLFKHGDKLKEVTSSFTLQQKRMLQSAGIYGKTMKVVGGEVVKFTTREKKLLANFGILGAVQEKLSKNTNKLSERFKVLFGIRVEKFSKPFSNIQKAIDNITGGFDTFVSNLKSKKDELIEPWKRLYSQFLVPIDKTWYKSIKDFKKIFQPLTEMKDKLSELQLFDGTKIFTDFSQKILDISVSIDQFLSSSDGFSGAIDKIANLSETLAVKSFGAIRTALSFINPLLKSFVDTVTMIRDVAINPVVEAFKHLLGYFSMFIKDVQDGKDIFASFEKLMTLVGRINPFDKMKEAFSQYLVSMKENIEGFAEAFRTFVWEMSGFNLAPFGAFLENLIQKVAAFITLVAHGFNPLKAFDAIFYDVGLRAKIAWEAFKEGSPALDEISERIEKAKEAISKFASVISDKLLPDMSPFVEMLGKVKESLGSKISTLFGGTEKDTSILGKGFKTELKSFSSLFDDMDLSGPKAHFEEIGQSLKLFITTLKNGASPVEAFKNLVNNLSLAIGNIFKVGNTKSSGSSIIDNIVGKYSNINKANKSMNTFSTSMLRTGLIFSRQSKDTEESGNALSKGIDVLSGGFQKFEEKVKSAFGKGINATQMLSTVLDHFRSLLAVGITTAVVVVTVKAVKGLLGVIKAVKGTASALTDTVKAFKKIPGSLNDISKAFKKNVMMNSILKVAAAIALLAASLYIVAQIDPQKLIPGIVALGLMMGAVLGFVKVLEKFKPKQIQAASTLLLSFAGSMGILSLSLIALSRLSLQDIGQGLGTFIIFIGSLVVMMKIAGPAIEAGGKSMLHFALAIGGMTTAMIALAILPYSMMVSGLKRLMAMLAELAIFMGILKKMRVTEMSIVVKRLGSTLRGMALALAVLSKIEPNRIMSALKAMGGMMLELAVFMGIMKLIQNIGIGGLPAMSSGILVLSIALIGLAAALKIMSTIPADQLTVVIKAFAALMGIIVVAAVVLGTASKGFLLFASAIAILGVGMIAVGASFFVLGAGLVYLLTVFSSVGALVDSAAVPLMKLAGIGALFIVGGAGFLILGVALIALGAGAILAGAGVMIFIGAMAAFSAINIPKLIANMQMFIAGLKMLAPQAGEATGETMDAMSTSIKNRSGKFGETAAATITNFINGLNSRASSLVQSGVQLVLNVLDGLSVGVKNNGAKLSEVIMNIIQGLGQALVLVGENLLAFGRDMVGKIIEGFADAIGLEIPEGVKNMVVGFTDSIGGAVNDLLGIGKDMGDAVAEGTDEAAGTMKEKGEKIPEDVKSGIESGSESAKDAAKTMGDDVTNSAAESFEGDAVTGAVDGMMGNITSALESGEGDISSIAKGFGPAFSSGLGEGIDGTALTAGLTTAITGAVAKGKEKAKDAKDVGKQASKSAGSGASDNKGPAEKGGADVGQGLVNGIKSKTGPAGSAGYEIGRKALAEAKRAVKAKSPSREFHKLGVNIDEGLILGIKSMMDQVGYSGRDLGKTAVSATEKSIKAMSFALDGIDTAPTIRPVVDLSGIQAGVDAANSIFAGQSAIQAQMAVTPSRFYDPNGTAAQATSKQVNNTISITLDYKAGADATQITQDIAAGLMKLSFMEA